MKRITRRTAIRGVAGAATVTFVAGCLGDDDDDGGNGDGGTPEEIAVDWVSAADNVDSEDDIVDETGEDSVTIANGERPGNNYTFEPGIVRVDSGTEIVWEWVSPGHDVTEISGEGETISDWDDHPDTAGEGTEHSTTFDDTGVALYECANHRAQNQRGAVIVE